MAAWRINVSGLSPSSGATAMPAAALSRRAAARPVHGAAMVAMMERAMKTASAGKTRPGSSTANSSSDQRATIQVVSGLPSPAPPG